MRRSLAAVLVLLLLPGTVVAQSPGPSASPGVAVDCADLAALLPTQLGDGLGLTVEVVSGVEGFDPDDMLDPFLGSLGLGRQDLCSVGIRYGTPPTELIGLLVRLRGAGPGVAEGLAAALAERLREYGSEVVEETLETADGVVSRLAISASGDESQLLVGAATTDSVLLTDSEPLLDALLPLGPAASQTPPASIVPASG